MKTSSAVATTLLLGLGLLSQTVDKKRVTPPSLADYGLYHPAPLKLINAKGKPLGFYGRSIPQPPFAVELNQQDSISKTGTWNVGEDWFVGDCQMEDHTSSVTIRSDGTGSWKSRVATADGSNAWWVTIYFYDLDGNQLYTPGTWTKSVEKTNRYYDWSIDFTFPRSFYQTLMRVNRSGIC